MLPSVGRLSYLFCLNGEYLEVTNFRVMFYLKQNLRILNSQSVHKTTAGEFFFFCQVATLQRVNSYQGAFQ